MAITKRQWGNILLNMLGLRSGATPDDIGSAASYAMDCGVTASIPFPPSIPENWDTLLHGTIKHMQEFPGYQSRYLLIVKPSSSTNFEYQDCFPKCSTKPTEVLASISLDNTPEELVQWVVDRIPSE
ncbi:hypothetical protein LGV61_11745 [Desulfurispirillum indicum]|uniref:Uncharacterized protein n=1 Tax=Desulfurispirillum indicum (strain ATCC BAA-1389 / DSM 22839 / S5) TaxID=653733 RepID=E6W4J5_DESIS|nr:hypothetical protein [Desulfurispirillum indicum]ADU67068.1 hypothetical protein Selin_2352 [Desulfurispirillum indicum S5]UCZ56387.1 hypothetical protein LGV61_11745 [Desulfurispirillum indicum]